LGSTYLFITCNWKHNGDGPIKAILPKRL